MDEYEKITKLLEEGKISPEEAEKLLAALDESESPPSPAAAGGWLRAQIDRADLNVRVDPVANEPRMEAHGAGGLELRREAGGWALRQKGRGLRIGFFNLLAKRQNVELVLPAAVGLDLRLAQGVVSVADPLPALRAHVGQGKVEFAGTEELDVQLAQGSVSGRVRLAGGSHRLNLGMGSVKLVLEEGSDLRLQLKTGMGEIAVTGALQHASEKAAAKFEGVVAEGTGLLKVSVGMGSVEVEVL